ncbi:unnamed protein product [Linum trigynum]|uniref:Uncharacterized protein n=1 Tax=Linum trigynum TaxID=586398 RepID=A0AAV2D7R3_9ROSI
MERSQFQNIRLTKFVTFQEVRSFSWLVVSFTIGQSPLNVKMKRGIENDCHYNDQSLRQADCGGGIS